MTTPLNSQPKNLRATLPVKHDVIVLLKQDHVEVKKLFAQFEKLAEKDDIQGKVKVANKICAELIVHTSAEEEIFYPKARAATHEDGLLNEAEVEHDSAKDLIAQIQQMNSQDPMYDAKVKVLGEYINHHVEEEETEMFPKVRRSKQLDLRALAAKFTALKKKLMDQLIDSTGEVNPQRLRAMIGNSASH